MRLSTFIVLALSLATVSALGVLDVLDREPVSSSDKSEEVFHKKIHKVPVNRDETVNDGKGSKYKTTTEAAKETTTEEVKTTTTVPVTTEAVTTEIPAIKTTPSSVPLDDVTTTQKPLATTLMPAEVIPPHEGHAMRWILGGLFAGIFVVIVSMYVYKFYRSRTESSYQNL